MVNIVLPDGGFTLAAQSSPLGFHSHDRGGRAHNSRIGMFLLFPHLSSKVANL